MASLFGNIDVSKSVDEYEGISEEEQKVVAPVRVILPSDDAARRLEELIRLHDQKELTGISRTVWQSEVVESLYDYYDRAVADSVLRLERRFKLYKDAVVQNVLTNVDSFEKRVVSYSEERGDVSQDAVLKSLMHQGGMAAEKYRMRKYVAKRYMHELSTMTSGLISNHSQNTLERMREARQQEVDYAFSKLNTSLVIDAFAPVMVQKDEIQNHVVAYIDKFVDSYCVDKKMGLHSEEMKALRGQIAKDIMIGVEPKVVMESVNDQLQQKYQRLEIPLDLIVKDIEQNSNWAGVNLRRLNRELMQSCELLGEKNKRLKTQAHMRGEMSKDQDVKSSELKMIKELLDEEDAKLTAQRVISNMVDEAINPTDDDGPDY